MLMQKSSSWNFLFDTICVIFIVRENGIDDVFVFTWP